MANSGWDSEDYAAMVRTLERLSEGRSEFEQLVALTGTRKLLDAIGVLSHKQLREIVLERVLDEQRKEVDRPRPSPLPA